MIKTNVTKIINTPDESGAGRTKKKGNDEKGAKLKVLKTTKKRLHGGNSEEKKE